MKTISDYELAVNNIRKELEYYVKNARIKSLVIGISGGIDSALCAALARPVCDELKIPLIGCSIFIESNKDEEVERAKGIGETFCTDFKELNYTNSFININGCLSDEEETFPNIYSNCSEEDIRILKGNTKARIRMIVLYNIAGATKGMVLSTDNYTEFLLGFWTLHGDVGDYGMIQNLWKTEVYNMSQWIYENEGNNSFLIDCIKADATDGLGITSTDLDQILPDWINRHNNTKGGYMEVDQILNGEIKEEDLNESQKNVLNRVVITQYKRKNPFNINKLDILKIN